MTQDEVSVFLAVQSVKALPAHKAATASGVTSFLEATARRFALLALEAEPANFVAEQRAKAP